jgi:hypothetical protein
MIGAFMPGDGLIRLHAKSPTFFFPERGMMPPLEHKSRIAFFFVKRDETIYVGHNIIIIIIIYTGCAYCTLASFAIFAAPS